MATTALVIYLVWFVLAFGVRTIVAVRRTGDSGWRGISGRPFTIQWLAGTLFVVALIVGVAAPAAALAGLDPLTGASILPPVGLVIAVVGVALTLAAQMSMGDSWRIGVQETERTDLVTSGAFTLARNPIFSAMAVTALGLTLMVPNAIAIAGLVAILVALQLQVRGLEEPYLLATHGTAYTDYTARVGRFLPGIGRLRTASLPTSEVATRA